MAKKQTSIKGTEPKSIKEIDDAAEAYVDKRDHRMKLTEHESDAKQALIALMRKHKIDVYKVEEFDPPVMIVLKPGKDGVKVTEIEEGADNEEEDDDAPAPRRGRPPGSKNGTKAAGDQVSDGA